MPSRPVNLTPIYKDQVDRILVAQSAVKGKPDCADFR
jgi:hypothetical protein